MTWYDRVPKVELHLHLEGAIPLPALWELIQKYGGDPAVPDVEALARRFAYRDFPHFIQMWLWKNEFLREYEDFTFIAEAVARDLTPQNVLYVEAFFSPHDFAIHGLVPQRLAEAIRQGLDRVAEPRIALVADLVRNYGPDQGAATLERVAEVRELGVIGVGIGGREDRYPPEPFGEVYERARELGFRTSAHAGEAAGPESVWGAIDALRVDRIGHGTRACEDPALVDYLAEHRIPVELCPISNLRTGVVASLERHPAKRYLDAGIPVTVNTDDPQMFGNSLADEYRALEHILGFSRDDVRRVILNGVETSWASDETKKELIERITDDAAWSQE